MMRHVYSVYLPEELVDDPAHATTDDVELVENGQECDGYIGWIESGVRLERHYRNGRLTKAADRRIERLLDEFKRKAVAR